MPPDTDLEKYRAHCTRWLTGHGPTSPQRLLATIPTDTAVDRYGDGGVVAELEGEIRTLLGKPAAAFFDACLRLAGCAPEECVFIDDLPANVAGARACGWHGIVYTDAPDLRQQLAGLGVRLAAATG